MKTVEEISAGNIQNTLPEFIRVNDVFKLFGIKRGILYRWIAENRIKSVCLREEGNKQGIRLIHAQSIRNYINTKITESVTN